MHGVSPVETLEVETSRPIVAPPHVGELPHTIIVDESYDDSANYLESVASWLGLATSYRDALARTGHALVPSFADWCVVDVFADDGLHRAAVAHADPQKLEAIRGWRFREPPEHALFELEARGDTRAFGKSWIVVPVIGKTGNVLGVLSVGAVDWRYAESDVDVARELGWKIGEALDTAPTLATAAPRGALGDLMELAQLRAGKVTLELDDVEAPALIDMVLDAAETVASDRAARVTRRCELHGVWLTADRGRLGQALGNLVGYALDACRHEVVVRGVLAEGELQISIADDGAGLAADELPRLFEPRRAGINLAIARAIVEAHGGAVRVASTLGGGTTFVVALPLE